MYRIVCRLIFSLSCVLIIAACSSPLQIRTLKATSFEQQPKILALLNGTEFDPDVRQSLAMVGFKTVKFASIKRLELDTSPTTRESFDKAETRFGLTVYPGRVVDWCITNGGLQLGRAAFELSDLKTNETILFVRAGGWTEICGLHAGDGTVWDKLAEGLLGVWK
jgi:hypothetical protein